MLKFLFLAVIVGTWNGNWFPSGRAEHRAKPEVEAATIAKAGKMLRDGIARLDPEMKEDVILCLNEIRGPRVAKELAAATGITNLQLAVISGYRRRDRFDMQQDVILTTLPVASANWSLWKNSKGVQPPRGYARAAVVLPGAVTTSVYCVHLKSNYGDTTAAIKAANREKRRLPVEQLVLQEKPKRGAKAKPVIIAGDFNSDPAKEEFKEDTIFRTLSAAGFADVVDRLPENRRWTHPNRKYGNTALDHVFLRGVGVSGEAVTEAPKGISDHYALFARLQ